MPYSKERLQKRNEDIRKRYADLKRKFPQWRMVALVEQVADEFYLSAVTTGKIILLVDTSLPSPNTIIKQTRQVVSVA
jgi:hypothetical protein